MDRPQQPTRHALEALSARNEKEIPVTDFFTAIGQPCPHPEGTRIEITGRMPDEPDLLPIGSTGTVTGGNGGQLHVQWDNGRTLMLLVGRDPYRVVPADPTARRPARRKPCQSGTLTAGDD